MFFSSSVSKTVPGNKLALDFFEESSYYRMKINGDKIVQRYLPARGNKNSIVRIIWTKGLDEKSHKNQA
jgi:hypothetical protein